jgi:glycerol-3-phosphate acyltransferase PlsY
MENITEFFSNPLAKTLGWTLVHSLWQILAITLVYFAIVLFTKKSQLQILVGYVFVAAAIYG